MGRSGAIALLSLALLAAAPRALAYGEEVDGYPSMPERQIHLFTDMLRVEPMTFWDGEGEYEARRPLIYNRDLNGAAYEYAHDMRINGCWNADHSSCDGTSFEARVSAHYPDYVAIGENIAKGYSTAESVVFEGWLYSDGHRTNMLHAAWNELGTGYDAGGSGGPWYVQDFGSRGGVEEPFLTSGAHWPHLGPQGMPLDFYTAFYDPAGEAPESVWVAVDTNCFEMELAYGEESRGVYNWQLPEVTEAACLPYAFVAYLADGQEIRLPDEGSLIARAGAAECEDYDTDPPPSPCTEGEGGGEVGGCAAAEPRGCETGTDQDVLIDNQVDDTAYGTCSQGRPVRGRGNLALVLSGGLLLAIRRLTRLSPSDGGRSRRPARPWGVSVDAVRVFPLANSTETLHGRAGQARAIDSDGESRV